MCVKCMFCVCMFVNVRVCCVRIYGIQTPRSPVACRVTLTTSHGQVRVRPKVFSGLCAFLYAPCGHELENIRPARSEGRRDGEGVPAHGLIDAMPSRDASIC